MSGSQASPDWYDPNMYGTVPGAMGTGMAGSQSSNGYTGQVSNLKDFLSAVLGGAGTVFGGFPGALAAGINFASGAKNGLGTIAALKDIFGSKEAPGATLSGGNIELSGPAAQAAGASNAAGSLGGTMESGLNGVGDITGGGNSMSGSAGGGDFGDHEHHFAGGGALNIAIRGRKRR